MKKSDIPLILNGFFVGTAIFTPDLSIWAKISLMILCGITIIAYGNLLKQGK
jgi:hypothetical protein